MKQITKTNGQIFEICTNRKDFLDNLNFKWLFDDNGIWQDEDSSLILIYRDGKEISYVIGDKKQSLRQNEIIKANYANPGTNLIYNCQIIYNKKYEDYEIEI